MAQAQGCVPGYGSLAVQDLGDAVGGNLKLSGQFRGTHFELLKLFGEMLAGMDSCSCHDAP
jgi:hypothetical protein